MRRSLFSRPDEFSLSPLLALLPVKGDLSKLSGLNHSLYARFEKVTAMRSSLPADGEREIDQRLAAEEAMLKRVLEWISGKPEGE